MASSFKSKFLGDKTRNILIGILIFAVLMIVGVIIASIVISYLRHEIATPFISLDVTEPVVWLTNNLVCDPYNVTQGTYRLNFYSRNAPFPHTVVIYELTDNGAGEQRKLSQMVIPQDSPPSDLYFSYILPRPGTYLVTNFRNGLALGKFLFQYPNPCSTGISSDNQQQMEANWSREKKVRT